MASPDLEDVIDACSQVFAEKFPAALAAVNARKQRQLDVKPPIRQYFGDIKNIPDMPSMLFTGHDTTTEEDEFDWRKQRYSLEIEAYIQWMDVQELSRMMRRYGAAIDDVLRQNQTLNGIASEILDVKQKYFDAMQQPGAGLMQAMVVKFDVIVMTN